MIIRRTGERKRVAHLHISPGEHGEDVEPPLWFFTWRPLEKVDPIGRRQRQAEWVASHLLRLVRHFHHAIHVNDGLRHRLGLKQKNKKEKKDDDDEIFHRVLFI